jgi:regulator of protease activity HflC (stomatin/prohibitin superfamily)
VRVRAKALGVELIAVGIRDVVMPGEMKDQMIKVTEAKKAAEANPIARREEKAAMRSQANNAKLLADNPTLLRLRELEVLEKFAANSKLNILLGDKGLTDRVMNVLKRDAPRAGRSLALGFLLAPTRVGVSDRSAQSRWCMPCPNFLASDEFSAL